MKKCTTIIGGLIFSLTVSAQTAMPFIRIDRNPISMSMGASQVVSPLFNPASAAQENSSEAMISYTLWSPGNFNQNLVNTMGYIKASSNMSINFTAYYDIYPSYAIADISGNETGKSFTPSDLMASAGIGYSISPSLSVGGTLHFAIQKTTEKNSYNAVFADIIANYSIGGLKVSAGALAIGGKVEGSYSLPTSITSGAVYGIELANNKLNTTFELDYFLAGGISASIGAEYCIDDSYFVRAGFHYGSDTVPLPTFLSLGAGVNISSISINLAYITANSIIGNSLSAGISYLF